MLPVTSPSTGNLNSNIDSAACRYSPVAETPSDNAFNFNNIHQAAPSAGVTNTPASSEQKQSPNDMPCLSGCNSEFFWTTLYTSGFLLLFCTASFQVSNAREGLEVLSMPLSNEVILGLSILGSIGDFLSSATAMNIKGSVNKARTAQDEWDWIQRLSCMTIYFATSSVNVSGIIPYVGKSDNAIYWPCFILLSVLFILPGILYWRTLDDAVRSATRNILQGLWRSGLPQYPVFSWQMASLAARSVHVAVSCFCVIFYRSVVAIGSSIKFFSFIPFLKNNPSWMQGLAGLIFLGSVLNLCSTRCHEHLKKWYGEPFAAKDRVPKSAWQTLNSLSNFNDALELTRVLCSGAGAFMLFNSKNSGQFAVSILLPIIILASYLFSYIDRFRLPRRETTDKKIEKTAVTRLIEECKKDSDIVFFANLFSFMGRLTRFVGFPAFVSYIFKLMVLPLETHTLFGILLFLALPNSINQFYQFSDKIKLHWAQKRVTSWLGMHFSNEIGDQPVTWCESMQPQYLSGWWRCYRQNYDDEDGLERVQNSAQNIIKSRVPVMQDEEDNLETPLLRVTGNESSSCVSTRRRAFSAP